LWGPSTNMQDSGIDIEILRADVPVSDCLP
jgi:hypothetical protein